MNRKQRPVRQAVVGGVLVVAAIAAGVYFARRGEPPVVLPPAPPQAAAPQEPADTAGPRHPIEQAGAPGETASPEVLPPLGESDAAVIDALSGLVGAEGRDLWIPQYLVQRFVATVDNLPRPKLAVQLRPVKPAPGALRVVEGADGAVLDPANADRYARHVAVAEAVDAGRAVAVYVRFYPLFQQAYRELGYPDGHFNDRLVEVIDHLLAAPEIDDPLALVPEKGGWAFADPALESLSSGHKLMLRLGPDNAVRVKAKLRELRAALAGGGAAE